MSLRYCIQLFNLISYWEELLLDCYLVIVKYYTCTKKCMSRNQEEYVNKLKRVATTKEKQYVIIQVQCILHMYNVNYDVNFYCISGRLQLIKKGLLSHSIQTKPEF